MENPGLLHIGERILKNVPFKSKLKCRLVKRSWNQILEKEVTKKTRTDLVNLLKSINEFAILPKYIDTNVLKYYKNVAKYDKNKTLIHFLGEVVNLHESVEYIRMLDTISISISVLSI